MVSIRFAKTYFSELIYRVERGETVVIARNGVPVAQLVPLRKPGKRQFGSMRGKIKLTDAFFDPLPDI